MATHTSTPSWLKINDDNFKDLLEYLCKNALRGEEDPFYVAATELLRERVSTLIPVLADDLSGDEDTILFRTRVFGAWLLCFPEASEERITVFLCMASCLSLSVSEELSQKLFQTSIKVLCAGNIDDPGFAWSDLVDVKKDLLAYKLIENSIVHPVEKRKLWYDGKGLLNFDNNEISLILANRKDYAIQGNRFDESLRIVDGKMCLYLPKDYKLKQSESSDLSRIGKFTSNFRKAQKSIVPLKMDTVKSYSNGDKVMVRVTDFRKNTLYMETADPNMEKISGCFHHKKGLFYYQDADFYQVMKEGDTFMATIENKDKGWFSIYDTMLNTLTSFIQKDEVYACEYQADTNNGALWFSNEGVPIYTPDGPGLEKGTKAYIRITIAGGNGYICGKIDEDQDGIEENDFDGKYWFIRSYIKEDYETPETIVPVTITLDTVRILQRALYYYQKTLSRATDIYKVLSFCQIMAELTGDERELHFLEFKADYLLQLVNFTKGAYSEMTEIIPSKDIADLPGVIRAVTIINILKEINRDGESDILNDTIRTSNDELVVRIARILQSYNRIRGIVNENMLQELKMEINKSLSIEGEVTTSLDDNDDEYLGIEDKVKEFKTSFVFPADKDQHMSANIKKQSHDVFRAVCAFLNSMVGGTVYLGVSDQGYVTGVQGDLTELKKTMDGYIRQIQDMATRSFDKSVLDFMDFEVMFDNRVVAIKVKPFEDGVVCLDGVPYKRNFAESVVMREDEKLRLIASKVVTGIDAGNKIGALEKAIRDKKRVILRRYSSATRIGDRKVEPFKLFNGGKSVWCYDIEAKANKKFNLSRMTAVDLLQDSWTHEQEHKADETDIFNWSGDTPVQIVMEMDRVARNILVDEFPQSEKSLTRLDAEGERWLLSTGVYEFAAPCRFYVGLAEHITITSGSDFKDYVNDYLESLHKI